MKYGKQVERQMHMTFDWFLQKLSKYPKIE
jgi:hypothetical protein